LSPARETHLEHESCPPRTRKLRTRPRPRLVEHAPGPSPKPHEVPRWSRSRSRHLEVDDRLLHRNAPPSSPNRSTSTPPSGYLQQRRPRRSAINARTLLICNGRACRLEHELPGRPAYSSASGTDAIGHPSRLGLPPLAPRETIASSIGQLSINRWTKSAEPGSVGRSGTRSVTAMANTPSISASRRPGPTDEVPCTAAASCSVRLLDHGVGDGSANAAGTDAIEQEHRSGGGGTSCGRSVAHLVQLISVSAVGEAPATPTTHESRSQDASLPRGRK